MLLPLPLLLSLLYSLRYDSRRHGQSSSGVSLQLALSTGVVGVAVVSAATPFGPAHQLDGEYLVNSFLLFAALTSSIVVVVVHLLSVYPSAMLLIIVRST